MATRIQFKRGDTFLLRGTVAVSAVPQDMTGWTVRAQLRLRGTLVADLVVSWENRLTGRYLLRCNDTTLWPVTPRILTGDIEYTTAEGHIISTETFEVEVAKDETTV